MRYHSFLSSEDAAWGEQEVIRFRWILVAAVLVLIGYIFLSGNIERGFFSLALALLYVLYNSVLNYLLRKFNGAKWIRYVSSTIDVSVLSAHIFNYSYFFTPIAVSTAPSILIYALLIMLSVLRYDGKLVIFTTAYVVLCSNIIYFIRYPQIDPAIIEQVASAGPEGAFYRSVYFILMGYFMFSIPKMINRLVERQNQVSNERREIEIKLALETQRKEMAMQNLLMEQQLSEQLNHQKDVIQKQKDELENLVSTKDKLFSVIGHDLRSPFCVQSSLSEYMLHDFNSIDKEALLESIYAINKTANNGLAMLTNLIDWSRLQNDVLDPRPVDVNVKKIAELVIDQQSEAWKGKNINIKQDVDSKIYTYVDEQMLNTVLRNLLSNAIKFTPDNGNIQLKSFCENKKCVIEISDSGVGMTENQIDNLFLLDRSISSTGTNNEKGTGIGLILSKEMIDKSNGQIDVNSQVGKGTCFSLKLPLGFIYT
ncbi:HAMP domain-containing histidine kinase [Labilibacter sediminis]|nr:HAMP domain-containing histidine kinase [Labilibacter sediminis]